MATERTSAGVTSRLPWSSANNLPSLRFVIVGELGAEATTPTQHLTQVRRPHMTDGVEKGVVCGREP